MTTINGRPVDPSQVSFRIAGAQAPDVASISWPERRFPTFDELACGVPREWQRALSPEEIAWLRSRVPARPRVRWTPRGRIARPRQLVAPRSVRAGGNSKTRRARARIDRFALRVLESPLGAFYRKMIEAINRDIDRVILGGLAR